MKLSLLLEFSLKTNGPLAMSYFLNHSCIGHKWHEIGLSCGTSCKTSRWWITIDFHFEDIVTHWWFRCADNSCGSPTGVVYSRWTVSTVWTRPLTTNEIHTITICGDWVIVIPLPEIILRIIPAIGLSNSTPGADFKLIVTMDFVKALKRSFRWLYMIKMGSFPIIKILTCPLSDAVAATIGWTGSKHPLLQTELSSSAWQTCTRQDKRWPPTSSLTELKWNP